MKGFEVIFRKCEYFAVPVSAKDEDEAVKIAIEYLNTCADLYHMQDKNEIEVHLIGEID